METLQAPKARWKVIKGNTWAGVEKLDGQVLRTGILPGFPIPLVHLTPAAEEEVLTCNNIFFSFLDECQAALCMDANGFTPECLGTPQLAPCKSTLHLHWAPEANLTQGHPLPDYNAYSKMVLVGRNIQVLGSERSGPAEIFLTNSWKNSSTERDWKIQFLPERVCKPSQPNVTSYKTWRTTSREASGLLPFSIWWTFRKLALSNSLFSYVFCWAFSAFFPGSGGVM